MQFEENTDEKEKKREASEAGAKDATERAGG